MKSILEIKHLSVAYGNNIAIKNVSLRVAPNAMVSLVGANGAGKTTLMKTIMGMMLPHSGEILFDGLSLAKKPSHNIIQQGITLSPEGREIFADMTVYENLLMGAYSQDLSKSQLAKKLDEIYSYFPILKTRTQQKGGTLSGGEQQMLAIGRALMRSPKLLLLDEPSLGISPLLTEKIFEILKLLKRQGMSILLAEQNANLALEISDYGYVLELGEVKFEDTAPKLISNDVVRQAYLGV